MKPAQIMPFAQEHLEDKRETGPPRTSEQQLYYKQAIQSQQLEPRQNKGPS